jgi:hypothetical protein
VLRVARRASRSPGGPPSTLIDGRRDDDAIAVGIEKGSPEPVPVRVRGGNRRHTGGVETAGDCGRVARVQNEQILVGTPARRGRAGGEFELTAARQCEDDSVVAVVPAELLSYGQPQPVAIERRGSGEIADRVRDSVAGPCLVL